MTLEINNIQKDSSKIHLRSEEITEIMGIPPKWLIRWGITIIFIIITVVFIGSAFFRYPDIVIAPVVLTSENPPSVIVAKGSGRLTDILYAEGSLVKKGDTLAVIENPARLKDVVYLSNLIKGFNLDKESDLQVDDRSLEKLNVGDIQNHLNAFSKAYFDLKLFLKQNYHELKVKALESEIKQYNHYTNQLWSQKNLTEKDLELTQKQFVRDSQLFKTGVIAAIEYEKSQAILLSKRQMLESAKLNLSSTSITIENLKQTIIETRIDQENQSKKLKEDFKNRQSELISNLSIFKILFQLF